MKAINRWTCAVAVVSSMSCLEHPDAAAATITSVSSLTLPGSSTGTVGPVGVTPAPNNDNTAASSPNVIPAMISLNALGFVEIEFAVSNSGGTTEYFFTQTLVNNTGVAWTDFHVLLGFGTGTAFVPAPGIGGLDFDTPDGDPVPTSSVFSALVGQPTSLDWSGGTVMPQGQGVPVSVAFTFSIDVPDNLPANRFTLRQFPTSTATPVPEPASLGLLSLGVAWAGRRKARALIGQRARSQDARSVNALQSTWSNATGRSTCVAIRR